MISASILFRCPLPPPRLSLQICFQTGRSEWRPGREPSCFPRVGSLFQAGIAEQRAAFLQGGSQG